MSEQTPGIPGNFVPTEGRKQPHSDLVTGLFREIISRPKTDYRTNLSTTLPVVGSPDVVHEFSELVATSPQTTSLGEQPEQLEEISLPENHSPASESTPPEEAQILNLSRDDFSKSSNQPLSPPPIHSQSPTALDASPSESGTTNQSERPELPFGEPLGPELRREQQESGRNSSGTEVLAQYTSNNHAWHVPDAPDYYFITKDEGVSTTRSAPASSFDVEAARRDFPALHQQSNAHPLIFLDNAATTQKPQTVIDALSHFYEKDNSNIHRAAYELAERATAAFENGREKVRKFLGAKEKGEIVFVRGATEAINLVANSFGRKFIGTGDEIILSTLEHHANIVPWQLLAKDVGAVIRVIPINDRGELILEEYVRLLTPRTKLVSITHVSNSLGTVTPVEEIIQLAHARGVHVLVDGSQSTPHLPVNVQALDADFYVFSGHKVFGPTGVGALYGKAHLLEILPPWQGGGHMIKDVRFERTVFQHAPEKFEAGTPNIAGVVGLGAAIDYLFKIGIPQIAAYEHALLDYATERLADVPGLRPVGTALSKASVLSFVIPGISNDSIASHLDKKGIALRAGHHCALPSQRHFGLESTVRPSLAFYNNRADVDALVQALQSLIHKHR